jgi:type II secretory pathway component PulF
MESQRDTLSPSQLALLLDEVAQLASAQRPLARSIGELDRRGMGKLGRVAGKISQRLAAGESMEHAISEHAGQLGKRTASVLQAVTRTGSIEPLFQFANSLRQRESIRVQSLAASIYPIVSILIGYLLLSVVMTTVIIQSQPSDVVTLRGPDSAASRLSVVRFCEVWRDAFWVPPLIAAIGLVAWLLYSRWRYGETMMPWLVRATNRRRWAEFCDSMSGEVESGSLDDEAIIASASIAGNDRFVQSIRNALQQNVATEAAFDSSRGALPPLIGWMIATQKDIAHQSLQSPDFATQWRVLGNWYRQESLRLTRDWVEFVPAIVGVSVGGGCVLIYTLMIFAPLWRELSKM